MYGASTSDSTLLHQNYEKKNWLQRNKNFLLGGVIVVLLACLGLTSYNNGSDSSSTDQLHLAEPHTRSEYLDVGEPCADADECKPCADEKDTPHCSPKKFGEPSICWCKVHRLYPGEQCFADEECKPKTCVAKHERADCAGHPRVCKCKPHVTKKDQCLQDSECPTCANPLFKSRCSGKPLVCKPCEFNYLNAGEHCTATKECLWCANKKDHAECTENPEFCRCKVHRLTTGEQCLSHEECKCSNPKEVAVCHGHPRVCNCKEREVKKVGEKCQLTEECKHCADPRDFPRCSPGEPGEPNICKCKIHRLYLGDMCFGSEECKPKPCLARGGVECDGFCKCKEN